MGGGLTGSLTRPSDYLLLLKMGFLLEWTENNCTRCMGSGGRCGFNETSQFVCFCPDRPHSVACRHGISKGAGCFILAGLLFLLIRAKSSSLSRRNWMTKTDNAGDVSDVEESLEICGTFALRRYTYSDLKKITDSFKENLGQGGYGGVFKGILPDGRLVAVKVLNESKGNGEYFINEVSSIGRTYHVNIVSLLGFCSEGSKRALIYEFMPNGSLEKFIYTEKPRQSHPLGWEKLYQIAIGVARGLEYLHRGCNTRILHFDIKPHNILLDKDFRPKISDFGLAKLCPTQNSTVSMLGTRGTVGYIAPEVFCRNIGGVSYKSDVYSYGMMVLEMVGGRKNIDPHVESSSEVYFPHWIYKRLTTNRHLDQDGYLGLHGIATKVEEETARKMVLVGLWCIQTNPTDRPSMSKVVEMLEGSLDGLQMPPRPFLSSSP
ncbi:LEAF RUST 10 DISEASE-RESISTANCE LOCUS RECEPTOR-LIKE PROTEIN KINASE-like 2.5 isoform X2 [Magnolia sinica]|uniref:LEAF RUST 10 DISEASE-RESISTANCE LOCUS RECEPTOR-LIKE PROTEIN KINASE-like 2.5 isoform X2 n=1 Tax=Magnolia sinica TaxID=86752 RepID=UPI002659965F|nr:LEAF RUST 10 DISEASE-RESISTANCE LOCUS RECEPTOR-LIKE PROTEIN KINASE-like 2.5 isoform X2 [Magnolia sinica]